MEQIIFLFLFFFVTSSIYGYGILLSNFFIFNNNYLKKTLTGLFGLIFLGFLSTLLHFFVPLNQKLNLLVLIIGFLYFFFYHRKGFQKFEKKKILFFLLIVISIFLMFYSHYPNEDFGYYHLPYIVNFTQEKIIIGLSNLQLNQGWNSMWLNISSFLYLPFFEYKSVFLMSACFFFIFSNIFYSNLNIFKNSNLTRYFIFFIFIFLITKFSRFNSYGIDVPSNFLFFLIIFFFFKIYQEIRASSIEAKDFIGVVFLLIIFATTFRVINIIGLLVLPYLIYSLKVNCFSLLKSRIVLFASVFGIIWLIQQFLYTSCIFFPTIYSCIETSWFDPMIVQNIHADTNIFNKSYQSYSGLLIKEEYLKGLNWLPNWFNRNSTELVEHIFTFLFPIILYLIFCFKKFRVQKSRELSFLYYVFIVNIFFIILWMFNAPVVRLGTQYLQVFSFVLMYVFFLKNLSFNRKYLSIILILAISFNVSKNIKRIFNEENRSFYPTIKNIKYKRTDYLNVPVAQDGITKSDYCWNVPSLCSIGEKKKIKVNITKNYKIISIKNQR